MSSLTSVTLESDDPTATAAICAALGVADRIGARAGGAPTDGFRGYAISLVTGQPGNVDALLSAAVGAGATTIKPGAKSLWGYGASLRSPDGAVWTLASSAKKDSGPVTAAADSVVLLLGVADVKASRASYEQAGLEVARSFGGKYAEFVPSATGLTLAMSPRKVVARNAGVSPDGSGSHRLLIGSDGGGFTDADGFVWEAAVAPTV